MGCTTSLPYVGKTEQIGQRRESALNVNRVRVKRSQQHATNRVETVLHAQLDRHLRAHRLATSERARKHEVYRQHQIANAKAARSGRR